MPTRLTGAVLLTAGLLAAAAHAQTLPPPAACPVVASPTKMVLKPYQVADLVIPAGDSKDPNLEVKANEQRLIQMIRETIAPKSWSAMGGPGTIDYYPMTMTLIVNQTPDVQEQIADVLARLRREQDTQVALEVRLVTVSDAVFERVGVDFNVNLGDTAEQRPARVPVQVTQAPCKCLTDKGAFLTDKQLAQFLDFAQGDSRTNVMQAPKVTALNGQTARVEAIDKQFFVTRYEVVCIDGRAVAVPKNEEVTLGFRMSARPVVSADHRSVQVDLKIDQTGLASATVPLFPFTMEITDDQGKSHPFTQYLQQPVLDKRCIMGKVTVPDGGTVLLGGIKKVSEGPCEYGPPVLSKVPYVNRLFKNVGNAREMQNVYVLVTPRVIINDEPERRQTGILHGTDVSEDESPMGCSICAESPACAERTTAGGAEESEPRSPACCQNKALTELLKAYDEACAAGHKDEAAKYAQAALILDPTCFAKGRGR
jgi:general secretion pathway protein D